MNRPVNGREKKIVGRVFWTGTVVIWTAIIAGSVFWNIHETHRYALEMLRIEARANYDKDLLYRRWVAGHGGVYVPITEKTAPNPYLSHISERDISTPSGRHLTLLNPAYMTRQVHELAAEKDGVHGHITSLNPIRPENAPDDWEAKALRAFASGATEVSEAMDLHGSPYFRLMRPLRTEQDCLKCHGQQGYQVGDIRGGISVSIPVKEQILKERSYISSVVAGHVFLWMLGLAGILVSARTIRERIAERRLIEEELKKSEERYQIVADNTYDWEFWIDTDGRFVYTSPSCEKVTGYSAADFEKDPALLLRLIHPEDKAVFDRHRHSARALRISEEIEFRIILPDGSVKWIAHVCQPVYNAQGQFIGTRGSNHDITLRKTAEQEQERLIAELKDALAKVRTLSGMLPICASCKKIRDDKGYWTQVETYIHQHTDVDFSHAICPECVKKLYPEYYDKIFASDDQEEGSIG